MTLTLAHVSNIVLNTWSPKPASGATRLFGARDE